MNFLGHAHLSFGHSELLVGNMVADQVKGRAALEALPAGIRQGVVLHRSIDEYFDAHPALRRAKLYFREHYGLYSGPIADTLFDHFLANDPAIYPTKQALEEFAAGVYAAIVAHLDYLPQRFQQFFPYMQQENWLVGYRTLKGMERALGGLHRRAKHMPEPAHAYQTFVAHYYQLNQCYFEIIDDLSAFVKVALSNAGINQ